MDGDVHVLTYKGISMGTYRYRWNLRIRPNLKDRRQTGTNNIQLNVRSAVGDLIRSRWRPN